MKQRKLLFLNYLPGLYYNVVYLINWPRAIVLPKSFAGHAMRLSSCDAPTTF